MVWWSIRTTWGSTATSGRSRQLRARFDFNITIGIIIVVISVSSSDGFVQDLEVVGKVNVLFLQKQCHRHIVISHICIILFLIWQLCSRSGSPETGRVTIVGKTDEATTLGTSERSTPTWWAIAWVAISFVLHSYFHISTSGPHKHHIHQVNRELFPGTWTSKHELRSVGKERPAANGWYCCYCCWEGVV